MPRRPQLTLDELHQIRWLLGNVMILLAVSTVFYMDIEAWMLMGVTSVAAIVMVIRPELPGRVPRLVHTLAFPAIATFFAADLWLMTELLPAMVRLDILLLLYRTLGYRQRRADLQIIVLGLFLIVIAGVLTVSLTFAGQILVYTACALAFLLVITLTEAATARPAEAGTAADAAATPSWAAHVDWAHVYRRVRGTADWRVIGFGMGLFSALVGVSAVLFLAIPRFQLESSMLLDRFITKKAKSGFSDTIRFGDVTEILQDNSVALSVDVSNRAHVPATPYWRMLVLDHYDNATFRLSPALRSGQNFEQERSASFITGRAVPRRGRTVFWTFYLEPGVSRYLPLLGHYERLRFRDQQTFRVASSLAVVQLRSEPVTMTAYQVEDFDLSGTVADSSYAQRWRQRDDPAQSRAGLQMHLGISERDRATVQRLLRDAQVDENLSAAAFAQRVNPWLRRNHSYTLSPVIPPGEGDPLVRWMSSGEAGHCELFAGAFVVLARVAGFPARVVTGFKGGTWNAYSNNFTIRNSDAHAWAEIFDETALPDGAWLRSDPLGATAEGQGDDAGGEAAIVARLDRSWTARIDSLRVFWYRRIVNFDRASQVETLRAAKEATQIAGKRLRTAVEKALLAVREWAMAPWDGGRVVRLLGIAAGGLVLAWLWRRWGRSWWRALRWRGGGPQADPVRREAGRWLARLAQNERRTVAGAPVVFDLQRLRFGARSKWPPPEPVFRRARQEVRAARRRAGSP
jgi:protein-glutamine gamma-glutamyltransferase